MTQINPYLAVAATGPDLVTLLVTDAYGHINGRTDLTPEEAQRLSDQLQILIPIDVKAVEVPLEPVVEATDWAALTKAQIVTRVLEDYGVELSADDTKAELVEQAQGAEAVAQLA